MSGEGSERPPRLAASRALLTPGPLPPLTHGSVTLLRHGVTTGLRYAFYHLGLPMPEAAPVRILRLRLYLDRGKLEDRVGAAPGGREVVQALLDPGGEGDLPPEARSLAAAARLHRLRLAWLDAPRRIGRPLRPAPGASAAELWSRLRQELSRLLPHLNRALLAELTAALDRRRQRARGKPRPRCASRAAGRLRSGRSVDLGRFGPLDLAEASWAEAPEAAAAALAHLAADPRPPADRYRGRFRETFRLLLTRLGPLYRGLGEAAAARGWLERWQDALLLPFELTDALARDEKPPWLASTVASNRVEYESLRKAKEPLDLQGEDLSLAEEPGERPAWRWAPLLPLP